MKLLQKLANLQRSIPKGDEYLPCYNLRFKDRFKSFFEEHFQSVCNFDEFIEALYDSGYTLSFKAEYKYAWAIFSPIENFKNPYVQYMKIEGERLTKWILCDQKIIDLTAHQPLEAINLLIKYLGAPKELQKLHAP